LVRPDPQIIWKGAARHPAWKKADGIYRRSSNGGGAWIKQNTPESWDISYGEINFRLKPMGFKHTGLFPEQAVNWKLADKLIREAGRPVKVLNMFAYTGGATLACLNAGASVTHVDASKGMVQWAKENAASSGLKDAFIRYIVDDVIKFVEREIRRGNKYDAIIMDPPTYGRGPNGEMWKIENDLYNFVQTCTGVLVDNPLFVLINSYTTGLQPMVLKNILELTMKSFKGRVEAYEVGIKTEEGIPLPCGAGGMFIYDEN
jgi:23S rRNA (cytosine1962-C5)-methyltransferase